MEFDNDRAADEPGRGTEPARPAATSALRTAPRRRSRPVLYSLVALAGCSLVLAGTALLPTDDPNPPTTVTTAPLTRADLAGISDWSTVYAEARSSVVRLSPPSGTTGTGFVYAPGRVATNAHVVAGVTVPGGSTSGASQEGSTVPVTASDGRQTTGKVLSVDPRRDLAIVSVPRSFTAGRSALAFVDGLAPPGSAAGVLGYPFGGDLTITTGVLSGYPAASRFASTDAQTVLAQTDAPVNPGNSGGPLLDHAGRVLGMVTLRPEDVDGRPSESVAFALPSALLARVLPELEAGSKPLVPLAGFVSGPLDEEAPPGGVTVRVDSVAEGSPADEAGLRPSDLVVSFAGQRVTTPSDPALTLLRHLPGDTIEMVVLRKDGTGHTEHNLTLELTGR